MGNKLKQKTDIIRRCARIGWLLPLVAMSGCVTPYHDSPSATQLPPSNGPHRAPVEQSQPETASPQVALPPVTILPGSGDSATSSQAVDKLLAQGWSLHEQSRYDASISVAERAMRIDRHRPELYQLLSRNYLATLQLQQAEQLARQGLSIGSLTVEQRSKLEQLLQEILSAD